MKGALVGIGIDLVDTARFSRPGERLLARLFTPAERGFASGRPHPAQHYAARFAAKEAVLKALGTGWSGGIAWTDVEVVAGADGAPSIRLAGTAAKVARKLGVRRWAVSLTHTRTRAAAVAAALR